MSGDKPGNDKGKIYSMVRDLIIDITDNTVPNPDEIKDKNADCWYLKQGSSNFSIELFEFEKEGAKIPLIEIRGEIMKIPENKKLEFYEKLLRLNGSGPGPFFGIRGEFVFLFATRETENLDYKELKSLVNDVRFYSDYFDNMLKEEFGENK